MTEVDGGWSFCFGYVVVQDYRRGGAPRSESKIH